MRIIVFQPNGPTTMKKSTITLTLAAFGIASSFVFSSCEKRSDAEKAADDIGDAVEEVADEIGDAIKKAE